MIGPRIEAAVSDVADQFFGTKAPSVGGLLKTGALAVCYLGLVIACLEPAPTASLGFTANIVVWAIYSLFGLLTLTGITVIMSIAGMKPVWAVVCALVAGPFILAPFSLFVEYLSDPDSTEAFKNGEYVRLFFQEVIEISPTSTSIGSMLALLAFRTGQLAKSYRFQVLDRIRPEAKLRELLPEIPERLGTDLIRAEAQDHYVYFVCAEGTATIKMSFKEAAEKLKPLRGLQCHRSHWVRLRHVSKISGAGSAHVCEMSNGDIIPISRRKYGELKRQK